MLTEEELFKRYQRAYLDVNPTYRVKEQYYRRRWKYMTLTEKIASVTRVEKRLIWESGGDVSKYVPLTLTDIVVGKKSKPDSKQPEPKPRADIPTPEKGDAGVRVERKTPPPPKRERRKWAQPKSGTDRGGEPLMVVNVDNVTFMDLDRVTTGPRVGIGRRKHTSSTQVSTPKKRPSAHGTLLRKSRYSFSGGR